MTDRERWQRVRNLFEQCLDRQGDDVSSYLEQACAGDVELRNQVSALLESDECETPFLTPPTTGAGAALAADAIGLVEQDRHVGNFRLTRLLGSGGMGTVFHAVRTDGAFEQEVAIKLIRPGMATDELLRRFQHERQTLANLNHPNIAKLLDGGADEDGTPYLVLEYIDGEPITNYCDRAQLSIDQRLQLMQTVCDAVAFAHRNLVVHRDLKPGNILVTREGVPKLVDFGISKLIDEGRPASNRTTTGEARRLMTPQYASPEQIRGESITTVSDVYSLGVVLYELLAGHRPYEVERGSPAEQERVICESKPFAPSTIVRRTVDQQPSSPRSRFATPETISVARSTEPRLLRKRLKGDLDTVVMTAMHKEPGRRYTSVQVLADDIARFQRGLPILARKDSVTYRFRKFAQRNKAGVAAGIVMALSVMVGVTGVTVGYFRQKAEAERARIQARKADRINSFLQNMLSAASPFNPQDQRDMTIREVLDRTAERIQTELEEEAEVRAAVHYTLGTTYWSLGDHQTAKDHLETSLQLRREDPFTSLISLAATKSALGEVLHELGDVASAEPLLREALALSERASGSDSVETAAVLNGLARLLDSKGERMEAVALHERSYEVHRALLGVEHASTLKVMNNLAAAYARSGQYQRAQPLYEQAIDVGRRIVGEGNPQTLAFMNNLAVLMLRQQKDQEAEKIWQEVLEISRRELGADDPRTMTALSNPAVHYMRKGRYAEAAPLLQELVRARERVQGLRHPQTVVAQLNLGDLLRILGRFEDAEAVFQRGLSAAREIWGADHADTLSATADLGHLYLQWNKLDEAAALLESVWHTLQDRHGAQHPNVLTVGRRVASLYAAQQRWKEAERLFEQTRAAQQEAFGAADPRMALTSAQFASMLVDLSRYDEALPLLEEFIRTQQLRLGASHPDLLTARLVLARALIHLGDRDEALATLHDVQDVARAYYPEDHWFVGAALLHRGEALLGAENKSLAAAEIREGLRILEGTWPGGHPRIALGAQLLTTVAAEDYEQSGNDVVSSGG